MAIMSKRVLGRKSIAGLRRQPRELIGLERLRNSISDPKSEALYLRQRLGKVAISMKESGVVWMWLQLVP